MYPISDTLTGGPYKSGRHLIKLMAMLFKYFNIQKIEGSKAASWLGLGSSDDDSEPEDENDEDQQIKIKSQFEGKAGEKVRLWQKMPAELWNKLVSYLCLTRGQQDSEKKGDPLFDVV